MTYLDETQGTVFRLNEAKKPVVWGKEFQDKVYLERDSLIEAFVANGEHSAAKLLKDFA